MGNLEGNPVGANAAIERGLETLSSSYGYRIERFSDGQSWRDWVSRNGWVFDKAGIEDIRDHALANGVNSAWLGQLDASQVKCLGKNLREQLRAALFNPRQRVILDLIATSFQDVPEEFSVYAAEGITPYADALRARFPNFVGSEYAPDPADQERIAPRAVHQDMAAMTFGDSTFDLAVVNEVFEHLPDLPASLRELARILKDNGILMATFPFAAGRQETLVKAVMQENGEIDYLMEKEFHGNPVDPQGGSLVFQVPGWDVLDLLKECGFKRAHMLLATSKEAGVTATELAGLMFLVASKG